MRPVKGIDMLPLEMNEDDNPYIQAFWKWLPEVVDSNQLREIQKRYWKTL
jgi:hypothetical protein